jgi:hypothetical protein
MLKSSSQILLKSLLMVLAPALIAGRLTAQQSMPSSEPQIVDQDAPAQPLEIAALISPIPELPEPAIASSITSSRSEASGFAFAPVVAVTVPPKPDREHRFWDRENRILFSAAGGLAVADFCVTRANLASGGKELNPVTRVFSGTTPGLAANFALETGGLISVNYLLHKTGHHKLERITSYVNIGSSAGAVAWGLSHR